MEVKVHKLTQDQEELFRTLLESKEELKVLHHIIETIVIGYEQAVNKVNLVDPQSERELLYRRLKADGARKLLSEIAKVCKV